MVQLKDEVFLQISAPEVFGLDVALIDVF